MTQHSRKKRAPWQAVKPQQRAGRVDRAAQGTTRDRAETFKIDLDEEFPHLRGAPIVEAVIHWHARAARPVTSEDVRKQLIQQLPNYPECHPQHQLEFQAQLAANGTSTQVRRDTWHGYRLKTADGLQIVQFTRDGVVFSRLTPYQNWNVFAKEAQRMWGLFVGLAEPSEVQRLGVRFINRVLPVELAELGRYLASRPKCLEPLGLPMAGFLHQSLHDVPGEPFRINVVQTLQPPAPPSSEGFGLIVDIDVFTTQAFAPADGDLREYLPKMRWLKNKAFFSLMAKTAIKLFEKER